MRSSACRLTRNEEQELIARWQTRGDKAARDILVRASLKHVSAMARRYAHCGLAEDDLVGEGCVGLLVAIDRYDPGKNVRFITYASYWMRSMMLQASRKEWYGGKTQTGEGHRGSFLKARRLASTYMARYGSTGRHLEKMARELNIGEERLLDILGRTRSRDLSLDRPAEDCGARETCIHERMADGRHGPDALLERRERESRMRDLVEMAMADLDQRERKIVHERFLRTDPLTLADLGRMLSVSREWVRQLEIQAKRKIAERLVGAGVSRASLEPYLIA